MWGFVGGWFGRHEARGARLVRRRLVLDLLEDRTAPALLGQQLFPSDNPWNQNIANAPVAFNSSAIIDNIVSRSGNGRLHPDFGEFYNSSADLYGIPYNIVHSSTMALTSVVIDDYADESDIRAAPIPANAVLEGDYQNRPKVGVNNRGDSHLLIWDADTNIAYEYYRASRPGENADGRWHADQETVWDMNTNTFRTRGYTSADAAGLSLLAGLVRPDEGLPVSQGGQGVINHAIRFTLQNAIILDQYAYPASHTANPGNANAAIQPPMGARFRLKSSFDIASLNPQSRVIAQAMRDYGMIVADNGSNFFFSGSTYSVDASNQRTLTWDDDDIQDTARGLKSLRFSDFEVIDPKPIVTGLGSNQAAPGTQVTIVGQNFSGAAGHLRVLFGNTSVAAVYVDDGHLLATVPNGAGTVDVRVQSGQTTPPDADNVNNTVWGYGVSALTPAARFTFATSGGNAAPFVITPATASAVAPGGTTSTLSVLGGDDGGEGNLVYTWDLAVGPSGVAAPTFSANGTNAAKTVTATFAAPGSYTIYVTIRDAQGLTTTGSVEVVVPAAQVVAPARGAVLSTDRPTFSWLAVANAVSYRIRIIDRTAATYVDLPAQGTTLALAPQQALTPGRSYLWRVGAVQANGTVVWAAPLDFSVAALAAPALIGPAEGASLPDDHPTLSWDAVPGAASYKVQITDRATGASVVRPAGATSLALTGPQALTPGHRYTWRVAAVSTNGKAVVWSVVRQMSVAALAAPALTGPANESTVLTDVPTLGWTQSPGAASYKVWVRDLTTGGVTVLPVAGGTALTLSSPLSPGRRYQWRVGALSTNGQLVVWSATRTFKVIPLAVPTLVGATGPLTSPTPTFDWNGVTLASRYEIRVTDMTTGRIVGTYSTADNGTSWVSSVSLVAGHRYRWWVRAVSASGLRSGWSLPLDFTVA